MLDEVVGGNGYGLKPDKNPDFLIEGKVFDCYTPNKTTKADTIIRKIQQKTNEQAPNITLNLELYEGDMDELIDMIKRKAVPEGDLKHLEELWTIKNNEIFYVFD